MVRCPGCGERFEVDELTRHDREGVTHVHCPSCGRHFGTYNSHAR